MDVHLERFDRVQHNSIPQVKLDLTDTWSCPEHGIFQVFTCNLDKSSDQVMFIVYVTSHDSLLLENL